MLVGCILSFNLIYFYKNNGNYIKKMLYKLNKIKWSHLPTLTINNDKQVMTIINVTISK